MFQIIRLIWHVGRFVHWDVLSLGTFCPLGRFVPLVHFVWGTFCPLGRFVPWVVLSLMTFCLWDILFRGRFVPWDVLSLGTFCPLGRFVPWYVFSVGRFVCASGISLGTFINFYFNIIETGNGKRWSFVNNHKMFVCVRVKCKMLNKCVWEGRTMNSEHYENFTPVVATKIKIMLQRQTFQI